MKRTLLLWALMTFVVCASLNAADYNVLVYPYHEEVSVILQNLFPTRFYDPAVWENQKERAEVLEERGLGESLHKAYQQQSEKDIQSADSRFRERREQSEAENLPFAVKVLPSSSYRFDLDAMLSGDQLYLTYLCDLTGADLIVIPVVSMIQNFHHLSLYAYRCQDGSLLKISDRLSLDSDSFGTEIAIDLAKLFLNESCSLVQLEGYVPGSGLAVDGVSYPIHDGYALVPVGRHEMVLSCMGYEDKTLSIVVESDSTLVLDASLERLSFESLKVQSHPTSFVLIDGKLEGKTPLVLDHYSLPMTLTFQSEGYQMETVSLKDPKDSISIDLKPLWLSNAKLQSKAKDEFYSDFARSLLIFGAKIALGAFHDGNGKFLSSLDMIANGALTVSVVDMVGSLIGYYRHSVYVTP